MPSKQPEEKIIIPHYGVISDSPLSETLIPKEHNATPEQCIADLRSLAIANPTKVIGRNYYRVHGLYSESAWTAAFGTFAEFKRQAGVVLTRQQHNHEKHVAKHASVDHYREFDQERKQYAASYETGNSNRHKIVVVISDLHDKECDPFYLKVVVDTCSRIQPDVLVFGGDIFDLPEFSRFDVDPREWDVVGRIKFVHENIFAPLRAACPNTQFDFIEGNHEARLLRHLCDATPALKVVLSDLHGMSISTLLGLDKYQINYIAKGDLHGYTKGDLKAEVKKNYKIYFDSFIVHHFPDGASLGYPGINGHHHRTEMHTKYNETFKAYQWLQIGCGHQRDASYCNAEKWTNSFCIVHVDTEERNTIFEPIMITDRAIVGGMYYFRD